MDFIPAIILGIVQGATEFLPISSSGHLILVREVLGLKTEFDLAVDALLHFATAAAVIIYFRKDIWSLLRTFFNLIQRKFVEPSQKTLLFALVIGTIPAVFFGVLLEGFMETTFRSAELVALTLLVGSAIFYMAEKYATQDKTLTLKKGLGVGLFQVLALLPGMSRSGMTISGGLFFGFTREEAARFGFLLSVPIILGAGLKKTLELGSAGVLFEIGPVLFLSVATSFVTGLVAIHYLLRYLKNHTLHIFIYYRVLLAVLILAIAAL